MVDLRPQGYLLRGDADRERDQHTLLCCMVTRDAATSAHYVNVANVVTTSSAPVLREKTGTQGQFRNKLPPIVEVCTKSPRKGSGSGVLYVDNQPFSRSPCYASAGGTAHCKPFLTTLVVVVVCALSAKHEGGGCGGIGEERCLPAGARPSLSCLSRKATANKPR